MEDEPTPGPITPPAPDELAPVPITPPTPEALLINWRRAPFPIDWDRAFGASGPLHLEVGFGDGRFTARRARAAPEARFVGLEVSNVSVQRGLARMRREGVENVRLVKLGAAFALRQLFAPASLASVTVNFPDPWPKERHARHRLLRREVFELLALRLAPFGEVHLATDHDEYLAFARAAALESGRFALTDAEPTAAVLETKYALKWRGMGKPLYYQVFRLERPPLPSEMAADPPLERPRHMPHAYLIGPLDPASAPPFDKLVVPYGDGHVIVHEALVALHAGDRWLFRVSVDEPDLHQQLLVAVQRRPRGELIVRLERFGDPLVTKTARGAVHAVASYLVDAAGLRIVARNY